MKTLIAVVAYNEEKSIQATIKDLGARDSGYDVAVIDNGSSDATVRLSAAMGVPVVNHCINTGGSAGVLTTYFLYAHKMGYDCLCQFDGDGQHLAAELPKILGPVHRGEADYVIGSRFLAKEGSQSTALRRVGIRLFSQLDSAIMGQRITDVTSGFRAYSRRVIEFFARSYRYELHDTNQLLLASHFSGARVLEVPVLMRERLHGQSEFDLTNAIVYPFLGVVNIAGVWLQHGNIRRKGN
jgi:glycosyltransferase involved in cell wall biosynthesis